MAGSKERPAGPLIAAYNHAKCEPETAAKKREARSAFASQFETKALSALQTWGVPLSEDFSRVVMTPDVVLRTSRGNVNARVTGIKNHETGEYERLTLDLEYGKQEPPSVEPKKPFKSVSVGVRYNDRRELVDIQNHDHWSDALGGDFSKSPKIKRLRQANTIMDYLIKHYESEHPSQLPVPETESQP